MASSEAFSRRCATTRITSGWVGLMKWWKERKSREGATASVLVTIRYDQNALPLVIIIDRGDSFYMFTASSFQLLAHHRLQLRLPVPDLASSWSAPIQPSRLTKCTASHALSPLTTSIPSFHPFPFLAKACPAVLRPALARRSSCSRTPDLCGLLFPREGCRLTVSLTGGGDNTWLDFRCDVHQLLYDLYVWLSLMTRRVSCGQQWLLSATLFVEALWLPAPLADKMSANRAYIILRDG